MITIIIPMYNNHNLTKQCLQSISKNSYYTVQTVVVDNSPEKDDKFAYHVDRMNNTYYVKTDKNLLFSGSNNFGYNHYRNNLEETKYIYFLNNDTEVLQDWDVHLINNMKNCDYKVALGSLQIIPSYINSPHPCHCKINQQKNLSKYPKLIKCDILGGCGLFVTDDICQELIEKTGYLWYESEYFYYEDDEISDRLKELGYGLYVCRDSKIIHHIGKTCKMFKPNEMAKKSKKHYEGLKIKKKLSEHKKKQYNVNYESLDKIIETFSKETASEVADEILNGDLEPESFEKEYYNRIYFRIGGIARSELLNFLEDLK